jgi:hypothetical protein
MFDNRMSVVHAVAARFWNIKENQSIDDFNSIQVVKDTGSKLVGLFPAYQKCPQVFFKVYFYDRGFNFEVAGLDAASHMSQVNGARTPHVLHIDHENRAILFEKRVWQDTETGWKRFFVQTLNLDWHRLGTWLRQFHDTSISQKKNEYFLRKRFEKIEGLITRVELLFSNEQRIQFRQIIDNAQVFFAEQTCEWIRAHGDFGLANFKLDRNNIEIIDFEDSQITPREYDILNCLVRLEYTRFFPHPPKTYQRICHQFLEGYGIQPVNTPAYRFLYLLIKLEVIDTYYRRRTESKENIFNNLLFYFFERHSLNQLETWLSQIY